MRVHLHGRNRERTAWDSHRCIVLNEGFGYFANLKKKKKVYLLLIVKLPMFTLSAFKMQVSKKQRGLNTFWSHCTQSSVTIVTQGTHAMQTARKQSSDHANTDVWFTCRSVLPLSPSLPVTSVEHTQNMNMAVDTSDNEVLVTNRDSVQNRDTASLCRRRQLFFKKQWSNGC